MSKQPFEIKPNFGPVYAAALYPGLCKIFQKHGYALAVHGSLARDFDLIAIPWVEKVSSVDEVLKDMTTEYAVRECDEPSVKKNHGRICHTFSIGFGECFVDLSFFPVPISNESASVRREPETITQISASSVREEAKEGQKVGNQEAEGQE